MLKKFFIAMMAIAVMGFGFVACSDDDDDPTKYTVTYTSDHGTAPAAISVEEGTALTESQLSSITADGYVFLGWYDGTTKAVADTYKVTKDVTLTAKWSAALPSSLVGKAFFNSTNGVGFAVLDETQYAWIHSNAYNTSVTQKYYIAEKTSDTEYSLTAYTDDTFAEETGTVYTVKVTESGISLSFTNAQHASQAGTEYAMTHVFSSLFRKTYSASVVKSHTVSIQITDDSNCTYGGNAYTYTITSVTADTATKTLTYTMKWYKDGVATSRTHTVLITDVGITFDNVELTAASE